MNISSYTGFKITYGSAIYKLSPIHLNQHPLGYWSASKQSTRFALDFAPVHYIWYVGCELNVRCYCNCDCMYNFFLKFQLYILDLRVIHLYMTAMAHLINPSIHRPANQSLHSLYTAIKLKSATHWFCIQKCHMFICQNRRCQKFFAHLIYHSPP